MYLYCNDSTLYIQFTQFLGAGYFYALTVVLVGHTHCIHFPTSDVNEKIEVEATGCPVSPKTILPIGIENKTEVRVQDRQVWDSSYWDENKQALVGTRLDPTLKGGGYRITVVRTLLDDKTMIAKYTAINISDSTKIAKMKFTLTK